MFLPIATTVANTSSSFHPYPLPKVVMMTVITAITEHLRRLESMPPPKCHIVESISQSIS
jgi:hypothetical protein